MNNYQIPDLFALGEIESKAVLKACSTAHQALGELKGVVHTMPNQNILLGTLPLQEAKKARRLKISLPRRMTYIKAISIHTNSLP